MSVVLLLDIPGRSRLTLSHAVFDLNGTLSLDGALLPSVLPLWPAVASDLACMVLTGDTFGTATSIGAVLGCPVQIVKDGLEKATLVRNLGEHVVAVGNGTNDIQMFEAAALSIAVLGPEGAAARVLRTADIVVPDIASALGLLLAPNRLVATLRP